MHGARTVAAELEISAKRKTMGDVVRDSIDIDYLLEAKQATRKWFLFVDFPKRINSELNLVAFSISRSMRKSLCLNWALSLQSSTPLKRWLVTAQYSSTQRRDDSERPFATWSTTEETGNHDHSRSSSSGRQRSVNPTRRLQLAIRDRKG